MSQITSHVLDTSLGIPASGIEVELYSKIEHERKLIASAITNTDGRIVRWLDNQKLAAGIYQLRFLTQPYFSARQVESFYPHIDITFVFESDSAHYHVPLLLSPFGYSTYRGS